MMNRRAYRCSNHEMQVPMNPKSTSFVKWYAIAKNARHLKDRVASDARASLTLWGLTKMDSGILIYAINAHGTVTTNLFKTHHQSSTIWTSIDQKEATVATD